MLQRACVLLVAAGVLAACEVNYPRPANDPSSSETSEGTSSSSSSSTSDAPAAMVAPIAEERLAPAVPANARAMPLLVVELEQLEKLEAVMPADDAARGTVLRRIGQSYAELLLRAIWRDAPAGERQDRIRAVTPTAQAWLAKLEAYPRHADWALYVEGLIEEQVGNLELANAAYARVSRRSALGALAAQGASKGGEHVALASRDPEPAAKVGREENAPRELLAGGELRVECPLGRHAQSSSEGGCACVSSDDGSVWTPPVDARCTGATARAEGDECILTCGDADAGTLAPDRSRF